MAYRNQLNPSGTHVVAQEIRPATDPVPGNFVRVDPHAGDYILAGVGIAPDWLDDATLVWAMENLVMVRKPTDEREDPDRVLRTLPYAINSFTANGAGSWAAFCAPGAGNDTPRIFVGDAHPNGPLREFVNAHQPALAADGRLAYIGSDGWLYGVEAGGVLGRRLAEHAHEPRFEANELTWVSFEAPDGPWGRAEGVEAINTAPVVQHLVQALGHDFYLVLEPTRLVIVDAAVSHARQARSGHVVAEGETKDPSGVFLFDEFKVRVTYEVGAQSMVVDTYVNVPTVRLDPEDLPAPVPPPHPAPPKITIARYDTDVYLPAGADVLIAAEDDAGPVDIIMVVARQTDGPGITANGGKFHRDTQNIQNYPLTFREPGRYALSASAHGPGGSWATGRPRYITVHPAASQELPDMDIPYAGDDAVAKFVTWLNEKYKVDHQRAPRVIVDGPEANAVYVDDLGLGRWFHDFQVATANGHTPRNAVATINDEINRIEGFAAGQGPANPF